jgi:hypothetical protein
MVKYTKPKRAVIMTTKQLTIVCAAVALIALALILPRSTVSYVRSETATSTTPVADPREEKVLDLIAQCESTNNPDAVNWRDGKLGTADAVALGEYQFKASTVVYYSEIIRGEKLSDGEAMRLALDHERARELARDMIFSPTQYKGIMHWKNCARKHNLVALVDEVKHRTDTASTPTPVYEKDALR